MLLNIVLPSQNEQLAQLAAQQYYVEHASDMNMERLIGLVPDYIPDACLQGTGITEKWAQQILNPYRKVNGCYNVNTLLLNVTGFAKTVPNVTRTESLTSCGLCLFLLHTEDTASLTVSL